MVVAMIALFVALSGTAVATTSVLITGRQIKNNSITGLDVRNRSLRPIDFRGSVRGPRGLRGLPGPAGAPNPNAVNSDKLDNYDAADLLTGNGGAGGATANINSCSTGQIQAYAVNISRPSRIVAFASSTYGHSTPGPETGTIRIQLLNAASSVVADTGRVSTAGTSGGNPTLSVGGLLLDVATGAPYAAAAGAYTLRLWGDNFGTCAGFGQYQSPRLTHLVLTAG
jgi:hypothetical protein